ncbi:MAG TPA: S53 family peptidase [Terriglobia bacterium]
MKKPMPVVKTILSACLSIATGFGAQEMPMSSPGALRRKNVLIPQSSIARIEDLGVRAHTNHVILAPESVGMTPEMMRDSAADPDAAAASAPQRGTPAALRAVYNLPSTGGAGVIAVVDAYDDPAAENDLDHFSTQFGLPACTTANGCFHKVYAAGPKPATNCGWAQEADLDIEWAHAIAPDAKIVLVEAASNESNDLAKAISVASSIVNPSGRGFGEVSMSWGFSEFSGETSFDHNFSRAGVVYVAAAGDVGGARNYPAVSPYVVAAGGTSLHYNSAGQFEGEAAWTDAGGGPSSYEERPAFQSAIAHLVGTRRGTPDVSFDADPNTGAWVYDSTPCGGLSGWLMFGGTSLSTPAIAGVINMAGHFYSSSDLELSTIYSKLGSSDFRDITVGKAGSFEAVKGWDFATGVGTSLDLAGK